MADSRSPRVHVVVKRGCALFALAFAGCVTGPVSDTMSSSNVMTFEGYYFHTSANAVDVFGVEPSNQSLTWLGNAPVAADDTWQATVNVPDRFWPSLCAPAAFRVFPSRSNQSVVGISQSCLANLPPNPTTADYAKCRADPILVTLATTYHGNLTVSGSTQAAQLHCVTEVDGDLTIAGGGVPSGQAYLAGIALALPNLRRVRGSLTVSTEHAASIALPVLTQVDGMLDLTVNRFMSASGTPPVYATAFGQLATPVLTTVGGDIVLHARKDSGLGGASASYDFGLDAVTSVGASVRVDQPLLPGTPQGLRNLLHLPGNLLIEQPLADFGDNQLLPSLQTIGGSLSVTTNPYFRVLLPALNTVSGNVTFSSAVAHGSMLSTVTPLLAWVGGDFTIENYQTQNCSAIGSLTHVGGTFRVQGGILHGYYGGSAPQFGAIAIGDAQGSVIPFDPGVTVSGAGPVTFTNNGQLCRVRWQISAPRSPPRVGRARSPTAVMAAQSRAARAVPRSRAHKAG